MNHLALNQLSSTADGDMILILPQDYIILLEVIQLYYHQVSTYHMHMMLVTSDQLQIAASVSPL